MTKMREPLSYHETLTLVAAKIGWERCAQLCGVSERAVRNWSDPDCEVQIRMVDAERLDAAFVQAGGGHAPFHRLMALRLGVAACDATNASLAALAARIAKSSGYAVAALVTLAHDPKNTDARRTARREMQSVVGSVTESLAFLEGGTPR